MSSGTGAAGPPGGGAEGFAAGPANPPAPCAGRVAAPGVPAGSADPAEAPAASVPLGGGPSWAWPDGTDPGGDVTWPLSADGATGGTGTAVGPPAAWGLSSLRGIATGPFA